MKLEELYNLASAHIKEVEYKKAIDILHEIKIIEPNNEKVYFNLGVLYFNLNQLDNSIEYYKKALSINSLYLSALTNMAISYKNIKLLWVFHQLL